MSTATSPSLAIGAQKRRLPDDVVFRENSAAFISSQNLAKRLVAMGRKYECAWCGIADWRGRPLVLHIDHINGVNNDNRLINLRFLCPNCHSQTDTYGNRAREGVLYVASSRAW